MEFQNRVLTNAGKNLLAQASSVNKIVFVRALSSTAYMDNDALLDIKPSSLTGPVGTIKTKSATNNVARIVVEYTNQPVATKLNTVAVVARLSTQSDDDAVVVMVQSDPNASIYVPSTSELRTSIQVSFNLAIGDAQTVGVNAAANVSLGDFERLMERSVTTHTDGDADLGDDQNVKGIKSFEDDTLHKTLLPFRTYGISFSWYDTSIGKIARIKSLRDILSIGLADAKTLCESIEASVQSGSSYLITAPTYSITADNVESLVTGLTEAGFSCSKWASECGIGKPDAAFDIGYIDVIHASDGVVIKNDEKNTPKEITIGTESVNSDCCIRSMQDDAGENYIEMRVKTQGGSFGPYIRANVDRTDSKFVSSITLDTQKFSYDAGDYGPTLKLKNDVSGGLNVGTIEATASNFKVSHVVRDGMGIKYDKFFEANSDGTVTATKFVGIPASLFGNGVGALVEITLASSGVQKTHSYNAVIPRGTVVRNGHLYDESGAEDPDTMVLGNLITLGVTSDNLTVDNTMRFAILSKSTFTISGSVTPGMTVSGNSVTVWAVRVE